MVKSVGQLCAAAEEDSPSPKHCLLCLVSIGVTRHDPFASFV